MATQYTLWENSVTHVVYRVANDGQSKIAVSGVVQSIDEWFTGAQPAQANTSDLRAWLNSIPSP